MDVTIGEPTLHYQVFNLRYFMSIKYIERVAKFLMNIQGTSINMSYHFWDDGYFIWIHDERLEGRLPSRPPDKVKKHKVKLRMDVQSINIFHYKHLKRFKEEL